MLAKDLRIPKDPMIPDSENIKFDPDGLQTIHWEESFELGQYLDEVLAQVLNDVGDYTNDFLTFIEEISERMHLYEYEEDVISQLAPCEKKAFMGSAEEIDDLLKFNRNRVPLVRGKEKCLTHSVGWRIPALSGGYIRRRMSYLISSGIYSLWEKLFYSKTREELDLSLKKTIETKQSLDTNLGALFKIVVLAWLLSMVLFFLEILISKTVSLCLILIIKCNVICTICQA
jgi:hypothetical protein